MATPAPATGGESKPPLQIDLLWVENLQFGATGGNNAIVVDGNSAAGLSPVQLLAIALAGCVSTDVVDILQKGRHPLTAFHASLTAHRASEPPRRMTSVALAFSVHGQVPEAALERAIALSRDKYCSVWHSLRQDIEFTTSFVLHP